MPGRFTVTRVKSASSSPKKSPFTEKSTVFHKAAYGMNLGTKLTRTQAQKLANNMAKRSKKMVKQISQVNIPAARRQALAKKTLKRAYNKAKGSMSAKKAINKWKKKLTK